jgi:hypothetical protein
MVCALGCHLACAGRGQNETKNRQLVVANADDEPPPLVAVYSGQGNRAFAIDEAGDVGGTCRIKLVVTRGRAMER